MNNTQFSRIFENKVRGWRVLNGNVMYEEDLVDMFKEQIIKPQIFIPEVDESRKVLLITAAFSKGHEHRERHIIDIFEKLNIQAGWKGRFPNNIQNLSVYSMFEDFQKYEPWLYRRYTEKQDHIKAVKHDYFYKNESYVNEINNTLGELKKKYPGTGLFELYYIEEIMKGTKNLAYEITEEEEKLMDLLKKVYKNKKDLDKCRKIKLSLDHLIYKDEEIFSIIHHIENFFIEKSGVQKSSLYQEQREELKRRILSSATIFIFGGRVYVLVNRLRFYQLSDVFQKALDNGSNVYGISAGSICQSHRFCLNFEENMRGGFLRAEDYGMGLISPHLQVFPHAEDYSYIVEADRDLLSFFALRNKNSVMIGLSEKSCLLCETYEDPLTQKNYERYSSVGKDPVLVFGERGKRYDLQYRDRLIIPGTKPYQGRNIMGTEEELMILERKNFPPEAIK